MARNKKLLGFKLREGDDRCQARFYISFGNKVGDTNYPCSCTRCQEDEMRWQERLHPTRRKSFLRRLLGG